MKMSIPLTCIVALSMALGPIQTGRAAEPESKATITISDLHCMGCAKGCATHLYALAGVAKVEANVEAKTMTVTSKPQMSISPRALWEAIEKGGKTPSKIQTPGGVFTAKPKQ